MTTNHPETIDVGPVTVGPVRTRPVTTDQHLIHLARRLDTIEHKIDQLVETYKRADAERRVETALDPMHNEMTLGPEDTARYLDSLPNESVILSYADMVAYQKADDDIWYGTGEDGYRTDHDIAADGPIRFLYAPQEDA